MINKIIIFSIFLFLEGCATAAPLTSEDLVMIDNSLDAYTVYAGIPKNKKEAVKNELKGTQDSIFLIPWDEFSQNEGKYIRSRIIKNEYPESRTIKGIIELVKKYPGTPIGLTWNGGIAITRNDYQHSIKTYNTYLRNPDAYEQIRIRDPRADPVKPEWHLGPLLGW